MSTAHTSTTNRIEGPANKDVQVLTAARIKRNRATYDALVDVVERCVVEGKSEDALIAAAIAANYAWDSPIGALADARLEALVVQAVRPEEPAPTIVRDRQSGRVLHVLTEAYAIGGHSRLARRWIERDSRRADLVLTNQIDSVPADLKTAVLASGGQVHNLRDDTPTLLARAHALRRAMEQADVVVLHVHPHDTIALAAATLAGTRPPIVFENHADHTYWLGVSSADAFANNRAVGQRICQDLRGISADRLLLLPVPVDPPAKIASKATLRAGMHIAPRSVLAVCIAHPVKMEPIFGFGFDQLAEALLRAIPDLILLVVGPQASGPWIRLEAEFAGRVHALGFLEGAESLLAAADIYLDSYPISGGTALLEAAVSGLPVLSLQETTQYSDVWIAESPGLVGDIHRAHDLDSYVAEVKRLAKSSSLRSKRAARTRASALAAHSGSNWTKSMEHIYEQGRVSRPASLPEVPPLAIDDPFHQELHRFAEWGRPGTSFSHAILPYASTLGHELKARLFASWVNASFHSGKESGHLRVQVAPNWADDRAWTLRALELASRNENIELSLPPVGEDDPSTLAIILELLSQLGLDQESCGKLSVDPPNSFDAHLALSCTEESLAFVTAVLCYLNSDHQRAQAPAGTPIEASETAAV